MKEDIYYHNRLMGRTYAEQDIRKIEDLKGRVSPQEVERAIRLQIAEYEAKLQAAEAMHEHSGVAHYTAYLTTFRAALGNT